MICQRTGERCELHLSAFRVLRGEFIPEARINADNPRGPVSGRWWCERLEAFWKLVNWEFAEEQYQG